MTTRSRFDALTTLGLGAGLVALTALLLMAAWLVVHRPAGEQPAAAVRPERQVSQAAVAPKLTFSVEPVFRFEGPVYLWQRRTAARRAAAPRPNPSQFDRIIRDAAQRHSLPPELVTAVARVESDFNPLCVSHKGARGLLQVMPETGKRFGIRHPDELFDPEANIAAGTAYLAWLMARYQGNLDYALAAYNAGEGAVDRHRGIPPYRETQEYVRKVRAALR
ncbi:MAG TPA: lytic transglycosylase domain-containing protein [Thermoanaerobaculia bacterium]|jgi:soluble lytic murein transglycosylase-like protein